MTSERRVLVVDDDPANLRLARLALERQGYRVDEARDGEAALAAVAAVRPDIVLTDLQMPGMDGFTLAHRLKADPATAGIVVVAMTAYALKGDRERTVAAGFDGYLVKPLDPVALAGIVAAFLRKGASAPPSLGARRGRCVLVVAESATTRHTARAVLEGEGHSVIEAVDGASALEQAASHQPALVLQDLSLPDMNGFSLPAKLRARLVDGPVPILCMAGFLNHLNVEDGQVTAAGFTQLLVKPLDPAQLTELVRQQLRARPRTTPSSVPGGAPTRRKLLLADDDPLQRKLSRVYLEKAGYRVIEAGNGAEALAKAEDERPDAVVSDVLMPEMDGFELCLALRRSLRLADVPVVLLSNHYIEPPDHQLAAKAGANELLLRTPDLGGVVAAVERALGEAAQRGPVAGTGAAAAVLGEHGSRVSWQLERHVRLNAILTRRCALQATQLAVLAATAQGLTRHRPLEELLVEVLASCLDMAGIAKGVLFLPAPPDGRLLLREYIGLRGREPEELAAFFTGPELGPVVRELSEATGVPSLSIPEALGQRLLTVLSVTSAVLVPVIGPGELAGVVLLGGESADVTAPDSLAFARVLGTQLAQAVGLVRAFDKVSAAELRYRTLMENAHDAVAVLREDGTVAEVNRRWEELLDRPRETIVGRPASELAGGDLAGPAKLTLRDKLVHLEFSQTPLEVGGERLVLSIGRDITERLNAQAQLMVADRMASVGMLAAGIAHEINNPLAAVLLNLELAASDAQGNGNGALTGNLANAKEAAERVKHIVREVRLFSRGAEDNNDGNREPLDVRDVLEAAVRMSWNEIRHRARLVRAYDDVVPVLGSESRLGQVFVNLIVNAAQAIPEGNVKDHEIRLSLRMSEGAGPRQVIIEVSDTGSGIPPEVERRLFTPFFTTKEGSGTGLGLSICQRIVTGMGGTISVETRPGRGSTFRVVLPAAVRRRSSAALPAVPAAPGPRRHRGRVLIIDDEMLLGQALCRALSRDHDAVAVLSAKEALARLRAEKEGGERFDLIVCDLIMPQMTGMDLYQILREQYPEHARRMVFLTGGAFTDKGRAFIAESQNPVVEKPVDIETIRTLVNERIGEGGPSAG